jgi:hypothetical protein
MTELPDERLHTGALLELVEGGDDAVVGHCSHLRTQDTITLRINEPQTGVMLTEV